MSSDWLPLRLHYERCLEAGGATPRGVDWPNGADLEMRFEVQLGLLAAVPHAMQRPHLLDLGCGPGLLLDYLKAIARAEAIEYDGIDISPAMVALAQQRWPDKRFRVRDIVADPLAPLSVDIVLMNGVLTERQNIPRAQMIVMAQALIGAAYQAARYGIAFNAMSHHVEYERDDLFHWSFDEVAAFLTRNVSRHINFRADYGLYEFTTFVWRHPQRISRGNGSEWWLR